MQGIRAVTLLSICLIMSACTTGRQIYISTSYSILPPSGSRVAVSGNSMAVLATIETWLRDRGLYLIDHGVAQTNVAASNSVPCQERCETTAALKTAKSAGADYVILFRVALEHAPERLSIVVKGFAVETGEEIVRAEGAEFLTGERLDEEEKKEVLNTILCHALATVWQYRPGGYSDDKSIDYCHILRPHA